MTATISSMPRMMNAIRSNQFLPLSFSTISNHHHHHHHHDTTTSHHQSTNKNIGVHNTTTNTHEEDIFNKDKQHHDLDSTRRDILQAALLQVHEHGWSEDAIAAAVVSQGLPITLTGLVNTSDLISFAMQTANEQFRTELEQTYLPQWSNAADGSHTTPLPDRLVQAIQARLTWILPFVQSRTWHDGMALGAMPYNILTTQAQLRDMIQDLTQAVMKGERDISWGPLEQTAIGAVYVATELHLLTDTSPDYSDSWIFLRDRVSELDMMAHATKTTTERLGGIFPSSAAGSYSMGVEDTLLVASAVVSSLAGAAVSLTLSSPSSIRAVRTAVDTVATMMPPWLNPIMVPNNIVNPGMRKPDGTHPNDYNVGVRPFPSTDNSYKENLESK